MFHATYEYLWAGTEKLNKLNEEANKNIKTRGYSLISRVPADFSNPKWHLAVNDIAYTYCPTNRYLYLKSQNKKPKPTWASFKGRILDKLLPPR